MPINLLDAAAMLSDAELLVTVKRLATNERQATAQLVAHLAEIDARRLYLDQGCSSLFTYCTQVLHLSEHAAYGRIEAARAARKYPAILEALANGALHVTAVSLIAPHLTPENVHHVFATATHRTKRDVEEIVAALRPQPAVAASIRKLPQAKQCAPEQMPAVVHRELLVGNCQSAARVADRLVEASDIDRVEVPVHPAPRPAIKPLAPEQYLVKFTASRAMHEKLREVQALLRHQVPSGDVAEIFDRALTLLLAEVRKARHATNARPRSTQGTSNIGRHVASAEKRKVWARDHVIPFADGGRTDASNLQLRCRAHNGFEAERWSGPREEDLIREARSIYGDRLWTDDSGLPAPVG